jgi:hypothetical protein
MQKLHLEGEKIGTPENFTLKKCELSPLIHSARVRFDSSLLVPTGVFLHHLFILGEEREQFSLGSRHLCLKIKQALRAARKAVSVIRSFQLSQAAKYLI